MLAQTAEDVADAIERLGRAAFEWKLDGARVQAHKSGSQIRVYTRNLNEVTSAVPEIVAALRDCPVREAILDGETIALKPDGTPTLSRKPCAASAASSMWRRRARRTLERLFLRLPAREGEDLTAKPARERFDVLAKILPARILIRALSRRQGSRAGFPRRRSRARPRRRHGKSLEARTRPEAEAPAGSRSRKRTRSTSPSSRSNGAAAGARAGSATCTWRARSATGGFVMLGKTFKV